MNAEFQQLQTELASILDMEELTGESHTNQIARKIVILRRQLVILEAIADYASTGVIIGMKQLMLNMLEASFPEATAQTFAFANN